MMFRNIFRKTLLNIRDYNMVMIPSERCTDGIGIYGTLLLQVEGITDNVGVDRAVLF